MRTFGETCKDGAVASSCLRPLSATQELPVETDPCPGGKGGCRNWKIFSVAPVLEGGWVRAHLPDKIIEAFKHPPDKTLALKLPVLLLLQARARASRWPIQQQRLKL